MSARQEQQPCWTADCDECGETFGYEEYSHMHCSTVEELRESATDSEWTINGDRWFCTSCSERRRCEQVGHVPDQDGYCPRCDEMVVACVIVKPPFAGGDQS